MFSIVGTPQNFSFLLVKDDNVSAHESMGGTIFFRFALTFEPLSARNTPH